MVWGAIAGAVTSGLISKIGSKKAEKQYAAGGANAQQIFTPKPFQSFSSFGSSNERGQFNLNDFGRSQVRNFNTLSNQAFNRTQSFDRNAFRDRLLEAGNRVNDKREQQAFGSLESKLFNRTGASTGTARQIADFQSDIEDRRYQRAVQSEFAADDFGRGRIGDYQNSLRPLQELDNRRLKIQQMNLEGGRLLKPFTINDPNAANAGSFRAQNTQSFFDSLGANVGGAVGLGVNYLNSGGSSGGGGYGYPFGGNGALQSYQNPQAPTFNLDSIANSWRQ